MKSRLSDVEAVLLTGGASRRMGTDKASLMIDGRPLAERVAAELAKVCDPVTVLGREPIEGYRFLADEGQYIGPLAALSRFEACAEFVFVASCDLPGFSSEIVPFLFSKIAEADAAMTEAQSRPQPLCALYKSASLDRARALVERGERRVMAWLDELDIALVPFDELPDRNWVRNVNSPEELALYMSQALPPEYHET